MKEILYSKIRSLFSNTMWTIMGLMLMNVVAQFIVYPIWAHVLGSEEYGNIIYILSIVNIFSISFGSSANYARMVESGKRSTQNGDYNLFLVIGNIVTAFGVVLIVYITTASDSILELLLIAVLSCAIMWRFYCDVEYRMNLDYKGYFVYYLVISIGYVLGTILFCFTHIWMFALLIGEILGVVWIGIGGKVFSNFIKRSDFFSENLKGIFLLAVTNIISNLVFNSDRVIIKLFLNGTLVTVYYVSSLIGKTLSLVTTPLNSVLIGYLVRFKQTVSQKFVIAFIVGTVVVGVAASLACSVCSYILIPVLYPREFEMAKSYFFIANAAQVIFFVTNVVTTVLLKFAKMRCQLIVNVFYGVGFCILCIPVAYLYGLDAFCYALLVVNMIRYIIALVFFVLGVKNNNS